MSDSESRVKRSDVRGSQSPLSPASRPGLVRQHGTTDLLCESDLFIRFRLLSVAFDMPWYRVLRLLLGGDALSSHVSRRGHLATHVDFASPPVRSRSTGCPTANSTA